MGPSQTKPTEDEWLRHKATIHRLYMVEEVPLKQLVAKMCELGLTVTKAQLEYKLKIWGFKKNIDKETWVSIDHKISKRKCVGKESEVIFSGKRLKPSTIEKETQRHRDMTIFAQVAPPLSPPSTALMTTCVVVCTPEALPMEPIWPESLPWLKFHATGFRINPSTIPNRAIVLEWFKKNWPRPFPTPTDRTGTELIDLNRPLYWLTATTGKYIPGSCPEDYSNYSQVLRSGNDDLSTDFMRTAIYYLSNNLEISESGWDTTIDLLHEYGLLGLKIDIRSIHDRTIQGFMNTLFQRTLDYMGGRGRFTYLQRRGRALDILKWLLSSHYDPDEQILSFIDGGSCAATPLQAAATGRQSDLMEVLLEAGADANLLLPGGSSRSPLELVLYNHLSFHEVKPIAQLLFSYGASMYLNETLHLAIEKQDLQFAAECVKQGADPGAILSSKGWYSEGHLQSKIGSLKQRTALCTAASVGKRETQAVLGFLKSRHPNKPIAGFVTLNALTEAAARRDYDLFNFLRQINPSPFSAHSGEIAALRAEVIKANFKPIELLLDIQRSYEYDVGGLSLLHLASYYERKDIVQHLINGGGDVNAILAIADHAELLHSLGIWLPAHCPPYLTPLQLEIWGRWRPYTFSPCTCTSLLLQAGATVTSQELLPAAAALHVELLSAALDAGGDANAVSNDGRSALEISLAKISVYSQELREVPSTGITVVTLLLDHGARLSGEDVALAVSTGYMPLLKLLSSNEESTAIFEEETLLGLSNEGENLYGKPRKYLVSYDASNLCIAVLNSCDPLVLRLLSLRDNHSPTDVLESTAIGLAANMGERRILWELLKYIRPGNISMLPKVDLWAGFALDMKRLKAYFWNPKYQTIGNTLTLAALGGDRASDAVEELIRIGCEPDMLTWTVVSSQTNTALVNILLKHQKRLDTCVTDRMLCFGNPLLGPIRRHDKQLLLSMLKAGADVDYHDKYFECSLTPLGCAIKLRDLEMVSYLLDAGADVNAHCPNSEICVSPLKAAIEGGDLEITTRLLNSGADVNEHNLEIKSGRSPLQMSVQLGNLIIANRLLEAGADVNVPAAFVDGGTALQFAAIRGHLGLVKQLLGLGADVNAPRSRFHGRTALEGAAENGRLDVLELLLHHGALIMGRGRRQYFGAVALATSEGQHAAKDLLKDRKNWTQSDEALLSKLTEATNARRDITLLDSYFDKEDDFINLEDSGSLELEKYPVG